MKTCEKCIWCDQCRREEVCPYYDPMDEVECEDNTEDRYEFINEWFDYMEENIDNFTGQGELFE